MSNGLQLISGTVSNLMVYEDEEEFVSSSRQRVAGVGAAAGLAAAGLAGAAVGASFAATSAGDSVQFFSCDIQSQAVAGQFSKASFKTGDELTVVVEKQRNGIDRVVVARRPSDQVPWMVPHFSRGGKAHLRFATRLFWWLLLVLPAFGVLSFLVLGIWANHAPLKMNATMQLVGALSLGLGASAALYYAIRFYLQWRPIAEQAELIFAALGYPDPTRVDLPRDHKCYCKAHGITWPYLTDGPWIYHYLDPRGTPDA